MTRVEQWIAFAALAATVIGAAFWIGATMATAADVDAIRRTLADDREALEGEIGTIRQALGTNREATEAELSEVRELLDNNMRELRHDRHRRGGAPSGARQTCRLPNGAYRPSA